MSNMSNEEKELIEDSHAFQDEREVKEPPGMKGHVMNGPCWCPAGAHDMEEGRSAPGA